MNTLVHVFLPSHSPENVLNVFFFFIHMNSSITSLNVKTFPPNKVHNEISPHLQMTMRKKGHLCNTEFLNQYTIHLPTYVKSSLFLPIDRCHFLHVHPVQFFS